MNQRNKADYAGAKKAKDRELAGCYLTNKHFPETRRIVSL